jgi:DNA-binding XRE family transcriptional regulator
MGQKKRDWSYKETVADWLNKQLNRKTPKWTIERLTRKEYPKDKHEGVNAEANVGAATLYKLKKDENYFISNTKLRDALAFNNRSRKTYLGFYGYPPIQRAENDPPGSITEQELFDWKVDDLYNVFQDCENADIDCYFCGSPNPDDFIRADFENVEEGIVRGSPHPLIDKNMSRYPSENVRELWVTSHCLKQYGPVREQAEKHFAARLYICELCCVSIEIQLLLVNPISYLIKEIRNTYSLSQTMLAKELGIAQSRLSKMENDEVEFIDPLIVKKLYGIFLLRTLTKDSKSFSREARKNFMKEITMKGFEATNQTRHLAIKVPSSKYIQHEKDYTADTIISCDLFLRSDDAQVQIACFFDCRANLKSISFLLAAAKNMGSTHVCLVANDFDNGNMCINIQHGHYHICSTPFNRSFLLVRDLSHKERYRELDDALSLLTNPNMFQRYISMLLSLKRASKIYSISQLSFGNQEELFDDDEIKNFFAGGSNVFDCSYIRESFEYEESILELIDCDTSVDIFIKFQVNVCIAIEKKHKSVEWICNIYNIDKDVVYAYQSCRDWD